MGLVLIYPMENELLLVHHVVKQWGCNYTIKGNRTLNEKIRGHPMLKPMSKLMQVRWE